MNFLIVHPEKGVLVLEVKGGGVGYDGSRHEWYTINARNERHPLHDPFDQARDSKHTLRRELTQRVPEVWLQTACRQSVFGHAIVVPDIRKERLANRPTRPEEIVLDRQDLQPDTILSAIRQAYRIWTRTTTQPLGPRAVAEIIKLSYCLSPVRACAYRLALPQDESRAYDEDFAIGADRGQRPCGGSL